MAFIIAILAGVNVLQFDASLKTAKSYETRKKEIRLEEGAKLEAAISRGDACYESQALYLQSNEKRLQDILFEYQKLKDQVNENKKN